MEMCLECEPFLKNIDPESMGKTLKVVNDQFTEYRDMVRERDKELETISMELAVGLSEVFEALQKISAGDPSVRIPEISELELIGKLKTMVNKTGEDLAEIVKLSHEFAVGLAEHFDVLHRVSSGDLGARVYGTSNVEILEALKKMTNQMIASVSREITERRHAEEQVERRAAELEQSNKQLEQFAYVISHDLQEPLRTVGSHLRLLARQCEGKLDEAAREFIASAVDAVNRVYKMIDQLLADAPADLGGKREEPVSSEGVPASSQ
jgi:methyl-accepting chemotaxis protein